MDAIVAVYSDWGIGAGGTQPVVLKADRQHFVELTRGRTVIATFHLFAARMSCER